MSPALEQEIIDSLYAYQAWNLIGRPTPPVRPTRLDQAPFFNSSRTLYSRFSTAYVPYALAVIPLLGTDIITQLYTMRAVSVLLGAAVALLAFDTADRPGFSGDVGLGVAPKGAGRPRKTAHSHRTARRNLVYQSAGQTFLAPYNGLYRIEVELADYGRRNGHDVNFRLSTTRATPRPSSSTASRRKRFTAMCGTPSPLTRSRTRRSGRTTSSWTRPPPTSGGPSLPTSTRRMPTRTARPTARANPSRAI